MQFCTVLFHAGLRGKAGLRPKIMRTGDAGCCKWCSDFAGEDSYPVKNHDMYRRHPNCRCKVEYDSGEKRQQKASWQTGDAAQRRERKERIEKYNVMVADEQNKYDTQRAARQRFAEKQSTVEEQRDNIETRKVAGINSITEDISEHPMKLASYTPETLKTALETNGYEVKPLKQGSLKICRLRMAVDIK